MFNPTEKEEQTDFRYRMMAISARSLITILPSPHGTTTFVSEKLTVTFIRLQNVGATPCLHSDKLNLAIIEIFSEAMDNPLKKNTGLNHCSQ